MKVLLVEPYYGGSHRAWADGYIASSGADVRLVSLPARFWKWRMHGGFLTLADEVGEVVASGWAPDVVLASSMMDVAAFVAAIRSDLPGVPVATFFHESQFTYPLSPRDKPDLTFAMKNWASAVVSDLVVFNSDYHRDVFADQAERMLAALPEYRHADRVADVIERAVVLPVGVDVAALVTAAPDPSTPPLILWNHRWEHDKGPAELFAIVEGLIAADVEFTMAMCGEVFVSAPPEFAAVTTRLGPRLVHSGWAERDDYLALARRARVVLSTAHQEFFGIGVVEGIAAGAHPVLPNRLVYPERIAQLGADPSLTLYDDVPGAVALISNAFNQPVGEPVRRATMRYDWSVVAPRYDDALAALVSSASG